MLAILIVHCVHEYENVKKKKNEGVSTAGSPG